MKKLFGIVLCAVLAAALLLVPAGAADYFGGVWSAGDTVDSSLFEQKSDGTIAIKGVADNALNYGLSLKDKTLLEGDFIVEMKVKVPADFSASAIGLFGDESGEWPTAALMLKISNYENHPSASHLGAGWEIHLAGFPTGQPAGFNDNNAGVTSSDWNTVKLDVKGNKVTVTINGNVTTENFEFTRPAEGGCLVIGQNGNKVDGTEFKDITITKGGNVVFTTTPAASGTGSSDTGSSSAASSSDTGSSSTAGTGSGSASSNPDTADSAILLTVTVMAAAAVLAVVTFKARKTEV